ncbi:SusD/RagB family nutrient-binding outer membrane lipoprotein, partial [bacterium]|nr:SusD/RagB family nutrient-binding outer membrane lipoprotein [bacterium]
MKKLFIIGSLVGILSMLLNSCDSGFEDINSNPNRPEQATSAYLATNIILSITNYGGDAKSFIANSASPKYVGYTNEGQMGAQYNNPSSGSFGSTNLIPNIEKMNEISAQSDAVNIQNSYKAIGKFAKSWIMFRMTMAMGDIPYSEAGQGATGLTKPKYDTQESVLINILNDLKEAEQLLAAGGNFSGDPTPYNGDAAKWRRA